jgi:hypothetical protein
MPFKGIVKGIIHKYSCFRDLFKEELENIIKDTKSQGRIPINTLQYYLQKLRDAGDIEFLDNQGRYQLSFKPVRPMVVIGKSGFADCFGCCSAVLFFVNAFPNPMLFNRLRDFGMLKWAHLHFLMLSKNDTLLEYKNYLFFCRQYFPYITTYDVAC